MADMRAERTRQYLRDALLALLLEKPYGELTVREVVERAQVSKNSFYNHYSALDALAQDCFMRESVYFGPQHRRRNDYASRHEACTDVLNDCAERLAFFKRNPNLAQVVLDNICISPYFAECRHAEEELLLDHLEAEYRSEHLPFLDLLNCARFAVWGMYGNIRAWYMDGMRRPVEEVAKEQIYHTLQLMAGMMGRAIEPEYRAAIEGWRAEQ